MKTAYKFRMYPNRLQEAQLDLTLETCRHLYNTALADRKNAYETEGISRSYEDQAAMLTVERKNGNFLGIYAHCLQDVLRRLDKSFKAFFRRVKAGENPGYPRFKGRGWYKSFTYPDSKTGYKMEGSKLTLSKIGTIRIFKHREVEGKIKTCTIKKDLLGHWYAVLVAEIEDAPAVEPTTTIGVDVGLKSLITTSAGKPIQYPRYYIQLEEKLAADIIVFENLNINGMLKNHHLAKHIQDHAWGKLIQFTQGKAAKAGKVVELVDARCTSQKCSQCGIMVPKTLADRVHSCPNCGLEMDRDINASLNILTLGLRGRAYRDTAKADQ
jgi:putative transposase